MILRYYIKNNKKIYTLKSEIDGIKTSDAHYKFIKVRNTPRSDMKFFKKG